MKLYVFIIIFLWSFTSWAQLQSEEDIRVELGAKTLTLDQPFLITIIIKNNLTRPTVTFPDFVGLEKRSASATSTTNNVGGKSIVIQTISQQYFASREGEFVLPDFVVLVDGNRINTSGGILNFVKAKANNQTVDPPLGDIEEEVYSDDPTTGDIFISAKASRASVYVKEGFSLKLALYVAKNAPIEMEFFDLNAQLQGILKRLRPATCWEENIGIEEIIQKEVTLAGRQYTEYQMYQAVLFPFTVQNIVLPVISLKMMVNSPKTGGMEKKKSLQTFYSNPSRVVVKPLPPHPQKDQVAVGDYDLKETLTRDYLASGESLRYLFTITGKGNLATINAPEVPVVKAFDFYPPDIHQTVQRSYEKVSGEKTFDYYIVAKQKGKYPMGRFFQWIYFNPSRARYDTLRSSRTITVAGEDMQTAAVMNSEMGFIYENIDQLDTTTPYIDYQSIIRILTNSVVLVLLGIMVWITRK